MRSVEELSDRMGYSFVTGSMFTLALISFIDDRMFSVRAGVVALVMTLWFAWQALRVRRRV